jgi:hypothetical protein
VAIDVCLGQGVTAEGVPIQGTYSVRSAMLSLHYVKQGAVGLDVSIQVWFFSPVPVVDAAVQCVCVFALLQVTARVGFGAKQVGLRGRYATLCETVGLSTERVVWAVRS